MALGSDLQLPAAVLHAVAGFPQTLLPVRQAALGLGDDAGVVVRQAGPVGVEVGCVGGTGGPEALDAERQRVVLAHRGQGGGGPVAVQLGVDGADARHPPGVVGVEAGPPGLGRLHLAHPVLAHPPVGAGRVRPAPGPGQGVLGVAALGTGGAAQAAQRTEGAREDEVVLTPNQVVAYNLARARLYRGWTHEQAGEALEPYLGTRWSVANFSAIERSVDGGRIRQFTADELFALSRGFGLPVGFFLTPPGDDPRSVRIATPDAKKQGVDSMELLDAGRSTGSGRIAFAVHIDNARPRHGRLDRLDGTGHRLGELAGLPIELSGLDPTRDAERGVVAARPEQRILGVVAHDVGAFDGEREAEQGHERPLPAGTWWGQFRTRWRSRLAWLPGFLGVDQIDTLQAPSP